MRLIKKGFEPKQLEEHKAKEHSFYTNLDKPPFLKELIAEQFGVCAYCQQNLKKKKPTIEHHCEYSICDGTNGTTDRRLDYFNLMAVCEGKGGNKEVHCDTMKSEKANNPTKNGLPMNVNPTDSAHTNNIRYNSNGNISSRNSVHNREMNDILNLNTKYLKSMRQKKWAMIFKNSKAKTEKLTKRKMISLIEKDLSKEKNGLFSNHFPGMSEYMKARFCK